MRKNPVHAAFQASIMGTTRSIGKDNHTRCFSYHRFDHIYHPHLQGFTAMMRHHHTKNADSPDNHRFFYYTSIIQSNIVTTIVVTPCSKVAIVCAL